MASHGGGHVAGYTPAKTNQGWGIALLVCALAVGLWVTAWVIHRNTYQHPLDPLAPPGHTPAAEAPAGGGH
jgi:hypothetical protein